MDRGNHLFPDTVVVCAIAVDNNGSAFCACFFVFPFDALVSSVAAQQVRSGGTAVGSCRFLRFCLQRGAGHTAAAGAGRTDRGGGLHGSGGADRRPSGALDHTNYGGRAAGRHKIVFVGAARRVGCGRVHAGAGRAYSVLSVVLSVRGESGRHRLAGGAGRRADGSRNAATVAGGAGGSSHGGTPARPR